MSNREEFLSRVQKALGRQPGLRVPERDLSGSFPPMAELLQPIAAEDVIGKFETELQRVAGNTYRAATSAELDDILGKILSVRNAKVVTCTRNPILKQAEVQERLGKLGIAAAAWPETATDKSRKLFRDNVFKAEVGISGVDFVLAESGSIVVTSRTEGAQLGSLAPPTHIALYRRSQAVAYLEEVLDRLPVPTEPSQPMPGRSVVFITGPSRTADIEQILIRGVHGPKEVHAILVEDSCLS